MVNLKEISKEIVFPQGDLWSDEPQMESYLHLQQMILLLRCLEWHWREKNDFFAAGNLTIYYSPHQRKSEDFRGSDFFVVLGVERKPRKSWVVWEEEGKYPHLIIEILSDSTLEIDKGLKKKIYQEVFRTPNYFWFNPDTLELRGFELITGQYQEIEPNRQGLLWCQTLEFYLGVFQSQLRFFSQEGELIPTPEESAEKEKQRADRLSEQLRNLGVEPQ